MAMYKTITASIAEILPEQVPVEAPVQVSQEDINAFKEIAQEVVNDSYSQVIAHIPEEDK